MTIIAAMISIMDCYNCCYGWYHEMTMVAAMIAAIWKRSDNNGDSDGDGRAEW